MESSDYVYGTIFVMYVVLFAVIGGYVLTKRKMRKELEKGQTATKTENDEDAKRPVTRNRKKKAE